MPITADYILVASMDVKPEAEQAFHEIYDAEHVPFLGEVPGVVSVTRLGVQDCEMLIGGERRTLAAAGEPAHSAIYELEDPSVLVSPEWAAAVERGRWPGEVRPHTFNRKHVLMRVMRGS